MRQNKAQTAPRRHPFVRLLLLPVVILATVFMFLIFPLYVLIPVLSRNKGVHGKGSITMFGVAQQRLLGYRIGLCADHLAHHVVPWIYRMPEWYQMLNWMIYRWLSDKAYGAARCNYVDEAVQSAMQEDFLQFVNLGAGVDTRFHRMSFPMRAKLFEADTVASQRVNLSLLPAEKRNPQVNYIACDFETENWLELLEAAGFDKEQKTVFIWEGVSMYLSQEALANTLAMFGQQASGSRMVLDIFDVPEDRATMAAIKTMNWIGEPMRSLVSSEAFEGMAEETSLQVVELLDDMAITEQFMSHEDGRQIGRCFPVARFVTLETM